jgi:preprotein translocase subunit SecE
MLAFAVNGVVVVVVFVAVAAVEVAIADQVCTSWECWERLL